MAQFLANPRDWEKYAGRSAVGVTFEELRPAYQRQLLLAVYPRDVIDDLGWTHLVRHAEETLWSLCEWTTGRGAYYQAVMSYNRMADPGLREGDVVVIPRDLLRDIMKTPTPDRAPIRQTAAPTATAASSQNEYGLTFAHDRYGNYAAYRLSSGETLYTYVAMRFTDARDHEDIMDVCSSIQRRSGINDVTDIDAGAEIRIPVELLSDRYRPEGSVERERYEDMLEQAAVYRENRVESRDLDGVVLILDPGHGGVATGTMWQSSDLYEDEIVYDISCRIRKILTETTGARVYMTMVDRSQGYAPTNVSRFQNDRDEELLTTPTRYENTNIKTSLYLRSYIANSLYRRETRRGVDPRKIIFASIHADALGNGKSRGTMVYIPGAATRGATPAVHRDEPSYLRYNEVREQPRIVSTADQRSRDEALSKNFAESILNALGNHAPPIQRHLESDPIRNQIRQRGGVVYVPSVIKHNDVPTKVLVEVANMTNSTDRARMADPKWRQWYAEAFVDALRDYYRPHTAIAQAAGQ